MIIYKTINLVNGKIYVGKDKNNRPNYLGSGNHLRKAIKKYGRNNFQKEILEYCSLNEELNQREIFWIKKLNSMNPKIGYNILPGGEGGAVKGRKLSDETKEKIRQSLLGKTYSEERRKNMSRGGKGISRNNGRKLSDETKEKMRGRTSSFKRKKHSKESLEKMSKSLKGKPAWNKGIPCSEETRKKISMAKQRKKD